MSDIIFRVKRSNNQHLHLKLSYSAQLLGDADEDVLISSVSYGIINGLMRMCVDLEKQIKKHQDRLDSIEMQQLEFSAEPDESGWLDGVVDQVSLASLIESDKKLWCLINEAGTMLQATSASSRKATALWNWTALRTIRVLERHPVTSPYNLPSAAGLCQDATSPALTYKPCITAFQVSVT